MKQTLRAGILLFLCLLGHSAPAAAAWVMMSPLSAQVRNPVPLQFTSYVLLAADIRVVWRVNGVVGGNTSVGTITPAGLYTPPSIPPAGPVAVTVTSAVDPSAIASATITVLNPTPSISSVAPGTVAPGPFSMTVDGVGFVPTSTILRGNVPLTTTFQSTTRLTATGTVPLVAGGMIALRVANGSPGASVSAPVALSVDLPAPRVSAAAAARFLEQVSWGADAASIGRVQQLGFEGYLEEQFDQPASSYPDIPMGPLFLIPAQQRFVYNAMTGPDQLRQRVAFALGQIFVVSGGKEYTPEMFVPFLRLLAAHAFGNHLTLLRKVTLSPTMGHYLDMVDNEKANPRTGSTPNENYARELLQLFTIGTDRLNPDGTTLRDVNGTPVPTYDQAAIEGLARVLTGYTYPTRPGATRQPHNPPYFIGDMEPVADYHDSGEKVLFDGAVVPPGQTAPEDLSAALDLVFHHPNTGPFLARRLIQHLVTSNPTPAYVARVSSAFAGAAGTRGDLRAVIKAIVLDPEARRGDAAAGAAPIDGHLREPIVNTIGLLKTLGASISETSSLASVIAPSGQSLFYPASVLNYFLPTYALPESGVTAPEFQVFTPAAAVYRANLAYWSIFLPELLGASLDISTFESLADDPALVVEAVNRALLSGRMSAAMRQSIKNAVAAVPAYFPKLRAQTALYLVASSSEYQVIK